MTVDTEAKEPSEAISGLDILRGRKTYMRIYESAWEGDGDEPQVVEQPLLLTNNHVATLERWFSSQSEMSTALSNRPVDTIRTVLSVVLGCSLDDAGNRMPSSEIDRNWAAVEGAFTVALGQTEAMAEKVIGSRVQRQRTLHELRELTYRAGTEEFAQQTEAFAVAMVANIAKAAKTAGLDWTQILRKAKATDGGSRGRSNGRSNSGSSTHDRSRSSGD